MRFHVLTIFPAMFDGPLSESIISRAVERGLVRINLHDIRDYATDKHRSVDDYPYGGGYGMVMKPEPIFDAYAAVKDTASLGEDTPVVLLTPQGTPFSQPIAERLATLDDIVLICGRYEGVDERVREHVANCELSVGDYVLSGGELAAMVVIDAVTRLIPGAVGSIESTQDDSFSTGLLQFPQYTRPAEHEGGKVPDILLSGNHGEIEKWRRRESLRRTYHRRPDLLDSAALSDGDRRFIDSLRPNVDWL
ncbi:MAG: tRNA (guanosine(37)-N1)-methyltransferase TrmD [Chloroflexota bacterium]|nr:tRNA (guanosine(37)-N1)-methyltransferase TrmD [Chloroflexota bacterium]